MKGKPRPRPPLARFRVHFQGGAQILTTAANALKAEQNARRALPGIVRKVEFLGPAAQ